MLSKDEYLDAAILRFDQAEKDAKASYDDACRKQDRKAELKESCELLAENLEKLLKEIDNAKAAKGEAEKQAVSLQAEVNSLKTNLPFGSRTEAEEKDRALDEERGLLEKRINSHQTALAVAKEAIDKARGELAGKEQALP